MSLYSKAIYPELSYQERRDNVISARTYDALMQILRLRDLSEGEIPAKISDEQEQRSMNWFLGD